MRTRVPRLLVAASASGAGKTTVTCALLQAFKLRGMRLASFKCGPDYIDPLFHREIIGTDARNLDLFLSPEPVVRALLADAAQGCDLALLEGAMGYYDGIAVSDDASAWDIARATDTPAVLVVDGRGRARSLAAEVRGFAEFRSPSCLAGVVLNRVSKALYPRLKSLVEEEAGLPVFGYLPPLESCALESRHLGLVAASEVEGLQVKLSRLAEAAEEFVDLEALLALARSSAEVDYDPRALGAAPAAREREMVEEPRITTAGEQAEADSSALTARHRAGRGPRIAAARERETFRPRIAIARDRAFCFYYAENLRLLERLGARLVFFSPLEDAELPTGVAGLYLGGGYPELHARELAANRSLRAQIRKAVVAGMPTVAECGGFLYLHAELEDDQGVFHEGVGVFPQRGFRTSRLGRFGYVTLEAAVDSLIAPAGAQLPAHEFHYWDSDDSGEAFLARKPQSTRSWACAHVSPTLYAGFPHLYFPGAPWVAERFVAACAAYGCGTAGACCAQGPEATGPRPVHGAEGSCPTIW